jgi:hypothetical protein
MIPRRATRERVLSIYHKVTQENCRTYQKENTHQWSYILHSSVPFLTPSSPY